MRVTVYDANPGPGLGQWFLKASWAVGCYFQKLFGVIDDYHGASSWGDALSWLSTRPALLEHVQYWGHGSPGAVWLAQSMVTEYEMEPLKLALTNNAILWLRCCSVFRGFRGIAFATRLAGILNCTVAGHTRTIGPLQSGLHTIRPGEKPRWSALEGDSKRWPFWMYWGNNTVTCFATDIPEGW